MKKILILLFVIIFYCSSNAQSDCPGVSICNTYAGSTTNGILDFELNSLYSGCLPGESANKSIWIQFCAGSNGTLRFTINPGGGGNDFDWAIWGPNSTCPPLTSPLRCSYAIVSGGSDNTGVNSTNNAPQTDLTEGAGGNQWTQDINVIANQCFVLLVNNYGSGSNNFTISFGGTATLSCSIMPIQLVYFNAIKKTCSQNILIWQTAMEINNNLFEIETGTNGIDFNKIYILPGAGNSNELKEYSYLDVSPKVGLNYYRLKQIDYNGNFEYSSIIVSDNTCLSYLKILKITNLLGQEVSADYEGLKFVQYNDGSVIRKVGN